MTTRRLSLIAFVLGIALIASVGAIPADGKRMMISGSVEAVEHDLHGRPKAVELVSPELGSFRVAPDRRGRMLLAHVGHWVTVFGTVEIENGARVLYVDGFRPLPLLLRFGAQSEVLHRAGEIWGDASVEHLGLSRGEASSLQLEEFASAVPGARRSLRSANARESRRLAQIEQYSV